MKTKEEIEKLAEQHNKYVSEAYTEFWVSGYTQCQKDNEEFMLKFACFHHKRMSGANQSSNNFYLKQSLELFNQEEGVKNESCEHLFALSHEGGYTHHQCKKCGLVK